MTFMESYKFNGAGTRRDKNSVARIDAFFEERTNECTVIQRKIAPGVFYRYAVMKNVTAGDAMAPAR